MRPRLHSLRAAFRGEFPAASWLLILVCAGVYLLVAGRAGWGYGLGISEPDNALLDFYERFGVVPVLLGHQPEDAWLGLLTGLFVHAGPWHLAFNLLMLRLFGGAAERAAGWPMTALVFVSTGVAGGLCHAVTFPASGLALVGASGSVAGLMGFALAYGGAGYPVGAGGFYRPAFWYGLAWLAAQAVSLVGAGAAGDWGGTAFVPHWTGLAAGVVVGYVWRRMGKEIEAPGEGDLSLVVGGGRDWVPRSPR